MASSLLNNRYQILQTLGQGGFGSTYLAEDTHLPSRRRCVIKQLKLMAQTEAKKAIIRERFEREAAVLETLGQQQPQIPELHAYFCEAGEFYLVQEWIEGETLTQQVQRSGTWTPVAVQHLFQQILPVLDYVHSCYIIHRDIKPDNIILRVPDGLPVLIDFGAVKEAVQSDSDLPTASSVVIGTPGFMSSEQAAGRPTYSSDLYSLALTGLFLISGKTPQDIPGDPTTGDLQWREVLAAAGVSLPQSLIHVFDRALSFHPRDRFATAAEMLTALSPEGAQSQLQTMVVAPAAPSQVVTQVTSAKTPSPPANSPSPGGGSPRVSELAAPSRGLLMGGFLVTGLLLGSLTLGWELHQSRNFDETTPGRPTQEQPSPDDDDSDETPSTPQESSPPPSAPTPAPPTQNEAPLPQEDPEWLEEKTIDADEAAEESTDGDAATQDDPSLDLPPEVLPQPTPEDLPNGEQEVEQTQPDPLPSPQENNPESAPMFDSTLPPLESENPEKHFLPSSSNNILGGEKLNVFEGDRTLYGD
ncbi:serine/threonine protein kinase [Sodalinema gerasimenkoae]|uniref:serine/threonine protein kinase n=1 Tax=Sodalinema gerasimenkoae TaxID=2862348 RepID=UPI001358D1F7|nr:serine/threonine-protein kinase [Sodalinema gerasimenkoae]